MAENQPPEDDPLPEPQTRPRAPRLRPEMKIEELPGLAPPPRPRAARDPDLPPPLKRPAEGAPAAAGASPPPLARPPRPVRRPPPPPPRRPEPPPEPPPEAEEEEAGSGRAMGYYFVAFIFSVALIGGIILGLREALNRGYLEQYKYIYDEVSLMPSRNLRPSITESSLQVFVSNDGVWLSPHVRRLRREVGSSEKGQLVLQEIFSPSDPNLTRGTLPTGCKLRGYYRVGSMAYLDVTKEFLQPAKPNPRSERVAVYSLVNSVVLNDPDIDGLQILVEGKPIESAWGWLDCSAPLGPDLSLVR